MYFTKPLLKSLSCISQKHCWNHFHVFHKKKKPMLKSLSCISQNHCWNHFHVFHNANLKSLSCEITFMYFTRLRLKSLSCISQNQCWNHFHVFHKTKIEITFMYFTKKKPMLKSLSCISQDQYWKHFHVFHLGRSPIRIRPTEKSVYFSTLPSFFFTKLTMQSQKKMEFPMPLHRKHCKEGATVVTQFWIYQDFLKCYFISIIIYKNPKKLRKRKIQKYIFL